MSDKEKAEVVVTLPDRIDGRRVEIQWKGKGVYSDSGNRIKDWRVVRLSNPFTDSGRAHLFESLDDIVEFYQREALNARKVEDLEFQLEIAEDANEVYLDLINAYRTEISRVVELIKDVPREPGTSLTGTRLDHWRWGTEKWGTYLTVEHKPLCEHEEEDESADRLDDLGIAELEERELGQFIRWKAGILEVE